MSNSDEILVIVSLRGGCDGLNLVGPSADTIYKIERRPGLFNELCKLS